MKIWSAKGILVGAVAGSLLDLSGCGSDDSGEATGTHDEDGIITVKLGVVGPKTGSASLYYKYMAQDLEAFSDDFEEQYKVRFDAVSEDDQGSPEETSRAVSRLINEEGVHAIL